MGSKPVWEPKIEILLSRMADMYGALPQYETLVDIPHSGPPPSPHSIRSCVQQSGSLELQSWHTRLVGWLDGGFDTRGKSRCLGLPPPHPRPGYPLCNGGRGRRSCSHPPRAAPGENPRQPPSTGWWQEELSCVARGAELCERWRKRS